MPIFWFILGILNLGFAIWAGAFSRVIFVALCWGLGYLMWTRPLSILTTNTIEMKSLLGSTGKVHPYQPAQLSIKDKSIYIDDRKILSTWWTDMDMEQVSHFIEVNLQK